MRVAPLALLALLASCVAPRAAEPPAAPAPSPPAAVVPPRAPAAILFDGAAVQGGIVLGTAPLGTTALTLDGRPIPVAADRRFLLAFDRDSAATAQLVATLADGGRVAKVVTVAPRAWRIERVDTPLRAGKTNAEFDRLRPAELAEIAAARAKVVASDGWRGRFDWPVAGRQTGWFGSQRVYQGVPGSYHSGADVAVPTGTEVRAPADGVVVLAADRPFTLEGNLLMIGHGMGLTSAFLHLSRILVASGAVVHRGEVVALSGATGRATGPHLHWGLSDGTARLDPLLVAGSPPAN